MPAQVELQLCGHKPWEQARCVKPMSQADIGKAGKPNNQGRPQTREALDHIGMKLLELVIGIADALGCTCEQDGSLFP